MILNQQSLQNKLKKLQIMKFRKQNLFDEITRLENSDDPNKEKKLKISKKNIQLET